VTTHAISVINLPCEYCENRGIGEHTVRLFNALLPLHRSTSFHTTQDIVQWQQGRSPLDEDQSSESFVDLPDTAVRPLPPHLFRDMVRLQCNETREL